MKKYMIYSIILICIFAIGCNVEKPIGGDRDEHGCLNTAGYTWCESKQKCLRTWEEECPEEITESGLTIDQAMEIAQDSECTEKGSLREEYMYNDFSRTWWIDLDMKKEFKKEYCNPACVVFEETKNVEINWRCTGALPPE